MFPYMHFGWVYDAPCVGTLSPATIASMLMPLSFVPPPFVTCMIKHKSRGDDQQIEPPPPTRRAGAETNHGPSPPRFRWGRIRYLVSGWCEMKLNAAGREILIKAVAQSIPTYSMSCFQLSKTPCKKITLAISQF